MSSDFLISFVQSLSGCKVTPGLYIVATPIGHLSDITLRALSILSQVDFVVCEDTRVTGRLLQHYGIRVPKISHHAHNEKESTSRILRELRQGKSVALVSDAGTPLVSDPGSYLIRAAVAENLTVTSIPGACAAIVGLSLSGLDTSAFTFVGFLPAKSIVRINMLAQYQSNPETLVFYEAPHRLLKVLHDMLNVLGDRKVSIARELTKKFEDIFRGQLSQSIEYFENKSPKGEFVIIVEGSLDEVAYAELTDTVILKSLKTLSSKDAAAKLATQYGVSKKDAYQRILKLKARPKT